MAQYTLKKGTTSFKYEGNEESAKMLASAGGYSIGELPTFTPYTSQQVNAKIDANKGLPGASTPNPVVTKQEVANQNAINPTLTTVQQNANTLLAQPVNPTNPTTTTNSTNTTNTNNANTPKPLESLINPNTPVDTTQTPETTTGDQSQNWVISNPDGTTFNYYSNEVNAQKVAKNLKGSYSKSNNNTKSVVNGFPQSSNEYDQWIAQGKTFNPSDGKWYEPSSGGGDLNGGGSSASVTGGDNTVTNGTDNTQTPNNPSTFSELYTQALKDVGISDIKTQFDSAVKEQKDLEDELNDKLDEVSNNPWMSQSVRDRESNRIKAKYENRLTTLTNMQRLYDSMYQQGIAEAKFITTGEVAEQQALAKSIQDAEEAKAELQQQAIDNKDKSLKSVNGGLYDTNTKSWVISPKDTSTVAGDDLLSVTEAASLGVPYGTTKSQAVGISPQGKTTQAQETVSGFATRIEQSNGILNGLSNTISKYNPIQFAAEMASPTSYLKSSIIQQYEQASRNIINAILRRESGAVISDQEFDNARKQYLPQPGDKPETLKQKQQNVNSVLNSYKKAGGNAYSSVSDLVNNSTSGSSGQTSSGLKYTISK